MISTNTPYVVVTSTSWDEPPRFRKQLSQALSHEKLVIYVERNKIKSSSDKCEGLTKVLGTKVKVNEVEKNIHLIRIDSLAAKYPRLFQNIRAFNWAVNLKDRYIIKKIVKSLGYESCVLINFQYNNPEIMRSNLFRKKIYLCNDEFFLRYNFLKAWWLGSYEKKVSKLADINLVHSKVLQKKFEITYKLNNVELLWPGHNFDCSMTQELGYKNPEGLDKKIKLCYMGFIDKRIDSETIDRFIDDERYKLYFIGPLNNDRIKDKIETGGIRHIGTLTGYKLQAKMLEMDAFIIPFDTQSEIVKSCTPNKLFPYLACGKPILTTDMSFPDWIPPHLYFRLRKNDQINEKAMNFIMSYSREDHHEAVQLALRNTWLTVAEKVIKIVES